MKRLLLLGGMTPDVTVLYYNTINRVVRTTLGGKHAAPLHLYSANLDDMVGFATSGNWAAFAKVYTDAVDSLRGRVDGVVVCAILAHKVAGQIDKTLAGTGIPLLHVADCVARNLKEEHPQIRTLGLLGPGVTMQGADDPNFFVGRLQSPENGFKVLIPETAAALEEVNRGMMEEVVKGAAAVTESTKAMFIAEARMLAKRGAGAIILGSTDLGFVLTQKDLGNEAVIIEPAAIHAAEAARWALEG